MTLSIETHNSIFSLFDSGHSYVEIGKALGLWPSTIRQICVKSGRVFKKKTQRNRDWQTEVRVCRNCGKVFTAMEYSNQKYCSVKCQRASGNQSRCAERRALLNNVIVDNDITLQRLYLRDNGICHICGEPCDWDDFIIASDEKKHAKKKYPSVDHIIPISKGGKHEWNNVKLAHLGCNASKGARV